MRRSEDCAIPIGHQKIVAVVKSVGACLCLLSVDCPTCSGVSTVPAPRPFSPFSSSSSRRKLRGTLAPMIVAVWLCGEGCREVG